MNFLCSARADRVTDIAVLPNGDSSLDPRLVIADREGKTLAFANDIRGVENRSARIEDLVVKADGPLIVSVDGMNDGFGGDYSLVITETLRLAGDMLGEATDRWMQPSIPVPLSLAQIPGSTRVLAGMGSGRPDDALADFNGVVEWATGSTRSPKPTTFGTSNIVHRRGVSAIAVSADGSRVLSGSADAMVGLGDASTGRLLRTLKGHREGVLDLRVHPDGRRGFSASADNEIIGWDLSSGDRLLTYRGHTDDVISLDLHEDGERMLSIGKEGRAIVWGLDSGVPRSILPLEGELRAGTYAPDGSLIVTGNASGEILVRDGNGEVLHRLVGHRQAITDLTVVAGNRVLVSASTDRTARVWDMATGSEIARILGHDDAVTSLWFDSGLQRLYTASLDGTVGIWDMAEALLAVGSP